MTETAFLFNLQQFADGEGDGSGGEGGSSGAEGSGTGSGSGGSGTAEEKIYSEKHVKKVHDENAAYRHKIKEYEAKEKAREEAEAAAAAEKLEKDGEYKKLADAAEKRAKKAEAIAAEKIVTQQRKTIRTEAKALLIAEGIIDPDDVALLDLSKVTWDEDADEPDGVEELVKAFKKAKPAKFKGDTETTTTETKRRATTTTPAGKGPSNIGGVDYRDKTTAETDKAWGAKFVKS